MPSPSKKDKWSQYETPSNDWSQYESKTATPVTSADVPEPTYWDALTNPVGSGGHEQGIVGGIEQVGGQAIKAMAQPFIHPVDTAKGVAKTVIDYAQGGSAALGQDLIGPMVQNYARDKARGGTALAVENLGGQLLGTIEGGRMTGAGTKAIGGKIAEGATAAREWWRPTSSPEVVPALEQSARKLTNAINPNPVEANQFIENIQQRMPEIVDYAKRTKNPLKTRLEFAKAARGAQKEVQDWYAKEISGPAAKQEVSIANTSYRGRVADVGGQRATVGDLEQRLGQINKELRPDYRQRNAGMVGSKLASEAELNAEANMLRSLLNKRLSETSGLSEAEVSNIRQMGGQLRHIADSTNETVTQRELTAGRAAEGSLSMDKTGIAQKIYRGAQGGTNAIADRTFQKALADFHEQRPSSLQPIMSRLTKGADEFADSQREYLEKVQDRLADRKKAIAQRAQEQIEKMVNRHADIVRLHDNNNQ